MGNPQTAQPVPEGLATTEVGEEGAAASEDCALGSGLRRFGELDSIDGVSGRAAGDGLVHAADRTVRNAR